MQEASTVHRRPTTDKAAISLTIRALQQAGHKLVLVDDGGEQVKVRTLQKALDAITAVDSAHLFVSLPDRPGTTWVWFVLGNEPEEVIADHGLSLSPVIDPLLGSWLDGE